MKKLIFTFLTLGLNSLLMAQTPITFTAADMPMPAGGSVYSLSNMFGQVTLPTISANGSWDYSATAGTSGITSPTYNIETLAGFTSQGIDMYTSGFKYMTSTLPQNMGYYMDSEVDFNTNDVSEKGIYVGKQAYGLGALTGNNLDSIKYPTQGYIVAPVYYRKYPFTYNSSWSSSARRSVDFTITVAAMGMTDVPSQHVFYTHRTDTIVGWGKARVYTPTGPSIQYDVLIDKTSYYEVDSIYMGGQAVPNSTLASFGIQQGQITGKSNRYAFYRSGLYYYFMSEGYGTDNTFTTPQSFVYCTDNLTTAVGVEEEAHAFTTVLYPNPAKSNDVHLFISNNKLELMTYTITDLLGRVVQKGNVNLDNNLFHAQIEENVKNGTYLLQLQDKNNAPVISERFVLDR